MKILITGISGFLGRFIEDHVSQNNQVYGLSKSANTNYTVALNENVPIFDQNFDMVIHAAGAAHFLSKKVSNKYYFEVNSGGTMNLIEGLMKKKTPKYFIYISSVAVYGLSEGIMIKENSNLLANDPYGLSKIEGEKIVQDWCQKNNIICTILRLPLLIGPNAPGNFGSMINAIRKGYYFNINGGCARKSMVLVEDVARFILKAAEVGGTYNLTDGYHPSMNELSHYIGRQFGKQKIWNIPNFFVKILARIGDISCNIVPLNSNKLNKLTTTLTFDDSKARAAFGWEPIHVIEGLKF